MIQACDYSNSLACTRISNPVILIEGGMCVDPPPANYLECLRNIVLVNSVAMQFNHTGVSERVGPVQRQLPLPAHGGALRRRPRLRLRRGYPVGAADDRMSPSRPARTSLSQAA